MAQLWVIRHGQASLFATDYDVLSPVGEAQSKALGVHLAAAQVGVDRAFCGPAKRQRDTASLCREGARQTVPDATVIDEFDEHDAFGMLARMVPKLADDPEIVRLQAAIAEADDKRARSGGFQRLFEAVMQRWLEGKIDEADAEAWPDFRQRVLRGLDRVLEAAGDARRVAVFTSVGPLAVLLQHALATTDLGSFQAGWRIRNASITRFEYSRRSGTNRLTLDGFNTLPHLPDPTTWTFR
ncbi:MAG: histidine phosphatase family protein [Myxococcota bacterium]